MEGVVFEGRMDSFKVDWLLRRHSTSINERIQVMFGLGDD